MVMALNERFILVIDVETANLIDCALVYDIGWRIIDIYGNTHAEGSFVIRDVFVYERELVKSAYYCEKIPEYVNDIQQGKRRMIDFYDARREILNVMKKYNCHTVAAYNMHFDRNALDNTLRYLTKSKQRWFFPYSTKFVCIWNMACNSVCQSSEYRSFAEMNRYYSNYGKNYKATAETVYAFLTNNPHFEEEHKGLDDVNIECVILMHCLNHNCPLMGIKRNCWMKVKRAALMPRAISFLTWT